MILNNDYAADADWGLDALQQASATDKPVCPPPTASSALRAAAFPPDAAQHPHHATARPR